ncbi:MAG: hypothetical protein GY705_11255 [Bacteroidetes bacterium]|nr:hypothetical protein [Bacteroidota bacterium]
MFTDIFRDAQTELWKHAERCLYYQYEDIFDLVEPYLKRLHDESLSITGGAWSRIATLACLSGFISTDMLIGVLENANLDTVWKGAAQVFTANINTSKHQDVCEKNLINMLARESISNQVVDVVERSFSDEKNGSAISTELAIVFLQNMSKGSDRLGLSHFLQWFSLLADRNPEDGLVVAETLATELEGLDPCPRIWRTEPLKAGLVSILREADEMNYPAFIARAINIQDRLLKLNIYDFESILELY